MESRNDLVSVVIPVYNSEKFLKESIDSVLNQTYQNLEIIAVDDGSTDGSSKILDEFSDRITVISQSNQGLASALNSGIKKITGKWFKWFSPDDILYPHAIETLVRKAKELPENTILYSNWDIINESGKKIRSFCESDYNHLSNFEYNVRLFDGQQINVNTTLIPTILFEKGCLIQELDDPVAIDYDFFLHAAILHNTKFYLITKPLVKYRVHSKQLSHKTISKTLSFLPKIRNQILNQLEKSEQENYLIALKKYSDNKPIMKKTMEMGLKLANHFLPEEITDKLLIFYLNKIRRSR